MKKHSSSRNGSWFSRKVAERTAKAIVQKNEEFALLHQNAGKQELLDYVRACAKELGFTPNAREIIGGEYICRRIGSWKQVLQQLPDLPKPGPAPHKENCLIYRQEYERQLAAFRAERQLVRQQRESQKNEKSDQRRQENREKLEKDLLWGEQHAHLSDRELLEYVLRCSRQLGCTPSRKDVEGARYIAQHFGSWAVVLELTGLPLPADLKRPKASAVHLWQKKLGLTEHPLAAEEEENLEQNEDEYEQIMDQ